jgi:hypothetical protein
MLSFNIKNYFKKLLFLHPLVFNLFFVHVPPDVISFQLCTPKVGTPESNVLTFVSPVANPKSTP